MEQCSNGTYKSHPLAKITTWTQRMFLTVLPKCYKIDIEPKLGSKQVLLNQHSKSANRILQTPAVVTENQETGSTHTPHSTYIW